MNKNALQWINSFFVNVLACLVVFSISACCSPGKVKSSDQVSASAKVEDSSAMTKIKKETPVVALLPEGSDPIPFSLTDLDGKVVSLDDYLGEKAVILAFWSFFCGPCREEIPQLDEVAKKYIDRGLVTLAVNLDGPKLEKAIRKYSKDGGYSFRVLWEEMNGASYKTADAYGVDGTPTLVFIGKNKKVTWSHVGKEEPGVIEAEIQKALGL